MKKWSLQELQQKVAFERDEEAYRQLFFYYHENLCRFSLGFVKVREAAEEVVSDVMLKIWNLDSRLAQIDNLAVYLFRATRNRSLNYLRDNQKYKVQPLDGLEDSYSIRQINPEEKLLQNEWQEQMQRAIAALPPKCQMVYKLIRENGFTYKEVAAIVGISENTVDRHLNNALHKMVKSVRAYAF